MTSISTNNLSVLQRRTMRQLSAAIFLTVAPTMLERFQFKHAHVSALAVMLLAALYVLPVVVAVVIISRYLREEQDEFVRVLVVRALLWGLAITMAGDAVAGLMIQYYSASLPLAMLNVDVLFASTPIAFRLLQRSYR